jgi:catechol-2,3-dioxygenase
MQVERTDFISVPVKDLERATRFYEETLRLPRIPGKGAWPEFQLGENVSVYLVEPHRMGVESWEPHTAHIALRVSDVAATRTELEARGVEFAGEHDTCVCNMAFFHDSEGNALMLHRRYASRG